MPRLILSSSFIFLSVTGSSITFSLPGTYNSLHSGRLWEGAGPAYASSSPPLSPMAPTPPASRRNIILGTALTAHKSVTCSSANIGHFGAYRKIKYCLIFHCIYTVRYRTNIKNWVPYLVD